MAQAAQVLNNNKKTTLHATRKGYYGGPHRRYKQRLRNGFFIVVFGFFASAAFFNASQKALIAQGSLEIDRLDKSYAMAKQESEGLKAERARLLLPQRIERVATEKLQMTKPVKVSYIKLEPPKSKKKESLAMAQEERRGIFSDIWKRIGALYY